VNRVYDPNRDITPRYLATVRQWIASTGEVLVIMRYLAAAGATDFALIRFAEDFDTLVDVCPEGTDIIVFRDKQLPLRGKVDMQFIQRAIELVPEAEDFLFVHLAPRSPTDPRCAGAFDFHQNLMEELSEFPGEDVALGICPNFSQPDNEHMISAAKGGIDGPR
jgi:hypothetical protein